MRPLVALMRQLTAKKYRRWVGVAILAVTTILVIRFLATNPAYITRLSQVNPLVIIAVIVLNIPAMVALAWANLAMLRLCGRRIQPKENALLTAYSSLVNFFGPLQSGPGVRAVYLKVRYGVRVRDYLLATLLYLGLYATFSGLFLFVGVRPWWQTAIALLIIVCFSAAVIRYVAGRKQPLQDPQQFRFTPAVFVSLAVAVLLQLIFIAAYFYVELRAVDPAIRLGQAISYAGAANFSLFVSLTPDAVGIREAFLVFSQHLHHISTADIVGANIIDRGSYVLYLLLLFAVVLGVHAKDKLRLRTWRQLDDTPKE